MSLGHFSLKDNATTQYKSRELKSVYIDAECRYLKLVMHKNFKNSLNIFNQIGFLSLKCFGDLTDDPASLMG